MRLICRICNGVMFIPIMSSAMRSLSCSGTWLGTGVKCFTGAHLALFLVTLLFLSLLTPLSIMGAQGGTNV